MPDEQPDVDRGDPARVDRFIIDEIDSVPHLEALLLMWRCAPQELAAAEIAEQLYIPTAQGITIAEDLHRRGLIQRHTTPGSFFFDRRSEERNRLLEAVEDTYRRELIRISGIIHSKASPSVRAFANAFRFRKD